MIYRPAASLSLLSLSLYIQLDLGVCITSFALTLLVRGRQEGHPACKTRNPAVADKPRDAFVRICAADLETRPSPYVLPTYHAELGRSVLKRVVSE